MKVQQDLSPIGSVFVIVILGEPLKQVPSVGKSIVKLQRLLLRSEATFTGPVRTQGVPSSLPKHRHIGLGTEVLKLRVNDQTIDSIASNTAPVQTAFDPQP
jgi:hypothetical protein